MSFGGGVVIWGTRELSRRRQRGEGRAAPPSTRSRAAAGGTWSTCSTRRTRPGTWPTSASGRPRPPQIHADRLRRDAGGLLPRGRDQRPRPGRAQRPPAEDRALRPDPDRARRRLAGRGDRDRRSPAASSSRRPWRPSSWRAASSSSPTTSSCSAGRFHTDFWLAARLGRLPGAHLVVGEHPLVRLRRGRGRRTAGGRRLLRAGRACSAGSPRRSGGCGAGPSRSAASSGSTTAP